MVFASSGAVTGTPSTQTGRHPQCEHAQSAGRSGLPSGTSSIELQFKQRRNELIPRLFYQQSKPDN
jgi:hypothetical protein